MLDWLSAEPWHLPFVIFWALALIAAIRWLARPDRRSRLRRLLGAVGQPVLAAAEGHVEQVSPEARDRLVAQVVGNEPIELRIAVQTARPAPLPLRLLSPRRSTRREAMEDATKSARIQMVLGPGASVAGQVLFFVGAIPIEIVVTPSRVVFLRRTLLDPTSVLAMPRSEVHVVKFRRFLPLLILEIAGEPRRLKLSAVISEGRGPQLGDLAAALQRRTTDS